MPLFSPSMKARSFSIFIVLLAISSRLTPVVMRCFISGNNPFLKRADKLFCVSVRNSYSAVTWGWYLWASTIREPSSLTRFASEMTDSLLRWKMLPRLHVSGNTDGWWGTSLLGRFGGPLWFWIRDHIWLYELSQWSCRELVLLRSWPLSCIVPRPVNVFTSDPYSCLFVNLRR